MAATRKPLAFFLAVVIVALTPTAALSAEPAQSHQMRMGDAANDFSRASDPESVPSQYRTLPDILDLRVRSARSKRVVVTFVLAEVVPADGGHSQVVALRATITGGKQVQVVAATGQRARLAVGGRQVCTGKSHERWLVQQSFKADSNMVVVSFPGTCLGKRAQSMFGFMGEASAAYMNAKGADGTYSSGFIGNDAVQRPYAPVVWLR
jgi:archaellum component FlaG (FlaF/FlaG flagellin family)